MKLNSLPASAGARWVKQGLRTFFRQPLALSGQFFMLMAAMWLVGLVPWVGALLKIVLVPAGTLGMIMAAREADRGRFPMPGLMLAAFRHGPERARSMLMLGVWWAVGIALVLGICTLVDGGELARQYLTGEASSPATAPQDPRATWAATLWIVLNLMLTLLIWHSPALTFFAGLPPLKSLFFSLVASKRNFLAYIVYMLLWSAVVFGLVLLSVAVLMAIGGQAWLVNGMVPLIMLMSSMTLTSIYFTFRDTFELSADEQAALPENLK